MKYRLITLVILVTLALSSAGCDTRRVAVRPHRTGVADVSIFYDELSPFGHWFQVDGFGWVWTPYGTPIGWRPYTHGHWVYTEYGWTWVSAWRWGWAPFHYGRWTHHARHGWLWVPGTVWGPAWVVWRHSPGWVGWGPLPPHAHWRTGAGLTISNRELDATLEPDSYSFVDERQLTSGQLDRHIARAERNATLLRDTENVTHYTAVDSRVVNHGIDVDRFEHDMAQKVKRHRIVDSDGARGDQVKGDQVFVFRPNVEDKPPTRTPSTQPASAAKTERQIERERRRAETEQSQRQADVDKQKRKEQNKVEEQRRLEQKKLEKQRLKEQQRIEEQRRLEQKRQKKQQRKSEKPPGGTNARL